MTRAPEKARIGHQQALADYLAVGPSRSLSKLCQQYTGTVPKPPGLPTLKFWSKRDGWKAKAASYDERVAQQVVEKAEGLAVETQFNQAVEYLDIAQDAAAALKEFIGDPNNPKKVSNAAEFATVANAIVRLSQHVELLSGNATSRADGTMDIECPEWLAERLGEPAPVRNDDSDSEPDTPTQH